MDVIIHQFLILICRSAPEISREVKEVVQYCTGLSDKRLDHGYIICYGRGVTVKCKSKIHLFSKMICQNICPYKPKYKPIHPQFFSVCMQREPHMSRHAVEGELRATCLHMFVAPGDCF